MQYEKIWLISLLHISASPNDKYNWITLLQRVSVNPGTVVKNRLETLKEMISANLADIKQVSDTAHLPLEVRMYIH